MDSVSKAKRSQMMAAVKGKHTKPEKLVRSLLHKMGFRFRLHKNNLPGKPDIFLRRYNLAIFIHGCFWHRHPRCKYSTTPKTRMEFWKRKFQQNRARDRKNQSALKKEGIKTLILWECEIKKGEHYIKEHLKNVLNN